MAGPCVPCRSCVRVRAKAAIVLSVSARGPLSPRLPHSAGTNPGPAPPSPPKGSPDVRRLHAARRVWESHENRGVSPPGRDGVADPVRDRGRRSQRVRRPGRRLPFGQRPARRRRPRASRRPGDGRLRRGRDGVAPERPAVASPGSASAGQTRPGTPPFDGAARSDTNTDSPRHRGCRPAASGAFAGRRSARPAVPAPGPSQRPHVQPAQHRARLEPIFPPLPVRYEAENGTRASVPPMSPTKPSNKGRSSARQAAASIPAWSACRARPAVQRYAVEHASPVVRVRPFGAVPRAEPPPGVSRQVFDLPRDG